MHHLEQALNRWADWADNRQGAHIHIRSLSDEELLARIREICEQLVQAGDLLRTEAGCAVSPRVPAGAERDLMEEAISTLAAQALSEDALARALPQAK
jgi:hypothetical protein